MLSTMWLAQVGHFLVGAVMAFLSQSLLGIWWPGPVIILAIWIPKEIWLDPKEEGQAFFWYGVLDLGVIILGIGAAVGIISIGRIF